VTKRLALAAALAGLAVWRGGAAAPVRYRFSFPELQHRWMQVEAEFSDLGDAPLELRISRSSPGRYAIHDFAKNVYDVHVLDADGRDLPVRRADASGWLVADHGAAVTVRYKAYGDRVDGTYLAIDSTHAHINMPAAIMWARGLDERPIAVTFQPPAGADWRVVTQLHAGGAARELTAPNLQYLIDSPAEFGTPVVREFGVGASRFRVAVHQVEGDAEVDAFARDVERVVREEGAIFGEYPSYEPGAYTFIVDDLPWADGDGMEHRNSTVITAAGSLPRNRDTLLDSVAHEFFHSWNVERIRPGSLEPFDLDRANLSGELWLAEGFTQYYGPLVLQRAGLIDLRQTSRTLGGLVDAVAHNDARRVRSAEQMSQMAPFIDGGQPIDRTNWSNTVISYYPFGGAIALALDLTLRDRTDNRVSLDDFMRAMWRTFGKPGGAREGYVDRPYTIADAEAVLAEVSGDRAFAKEFFAKYIQGHDAADYDRLLARAGFAVRKRRPGQAWLGDLQLQPTDGGVHVAGLVSPAWPVYAAGLDQDDELRQIDRRVIAAPDDVAAALQRHKPGDEVAIVFVDRTRLQKTATVRLVEDPHVNVVPVEASGTLTPAQRTFRDRWLKSVS
jgi:predicted metalloprotease with PDZ domain